MTAIRRLLTTTLVASIFLTPWTSAQTIQAPSLSELKQAIDQGQSWVRDQRSPDAHYGTPLLTAKTLAVFATSHRKYRPVDGPWFDVPFQSMLSHFDGKAFVSPEQPGETARFNHYAKQVLEAVKPAGRAAELAGATAAVAADPSFTARVPIADEHLAGRATALLMTRDSNGGWPKGAPNVAATLTSLEDLNQIYATLKRRAEKKKSGPVQKLPPLEPATRAKLEAAIERGVRFLVEAQDEQGRWGFGGEADPGITAMVVGAVQALDPSVRGDAVQASIDRSLAWLASLQDGAGAIHAGHLKNYVTSASVMALARSNDPKYAQTIARARTFLTDLQADEGEGYSSEDLYYGGVGYGGDERPDLSNMQLALEALAKSGDAAENEDTFAKALAFLQRCQNNSETNDLTLDRDGKVIKSGNDGGAGYAPGESKAGFVPLPDGTQVPKSYGSMTYALLKCYLFAGLPREDARVEAAWKWISKNWTLDVNPGFEASRDPAAAYQGLFYYFYTMSKALALYGEPTVTDAAGRAHDWRAELGGRLLSLQRADGSWRNGNSERWFEGHPILATAYALAALDALVADDAKSTNEPAPAR